MVQRKDALDGGQAHRRAAVAAQEAGTELRQQAGQRMAQQRRRLRRVQDDVIVGGLDPVDVGHLHDPRAAALGHQQLAHRQAGRGGRRRRTLAALAQARQGTPQALLAEGLEQVIDGVGIEGAQRVFIVRSDEHDQRTGLGQGCG